MIVSGADFVFETSTTQGTGTLNLLGPVTGWRSFVAGVGTGNKVSYVITQYDGSELIAWETGIGTVISGSPDTLARNSVISSSNSNAAVSFGAGTRNVYLAPVARLVVNRDDLLNMVEGFGTGGGTANAQTVTLPQQPLGYSDGMNGYFYATVANTGAMTINVNNLGAKAAKMNGADVPPGAVAVGSLVRWVYRTITDVIEINSSSYTATNLAKAAAISADNLLINAAFNVNQRGYVSGTNTTVANQYTIDRWRVVTSGQNLVTTTAGQITAPAGGVEQVIEGVNILGGTYTLSWTGTATATVNGVAVANGAQVVLTALTNATVRFIGGTVSKPQLELGSFVSTFEKLDYALELLRCQRYYETGHGYYVSYASSAGSVQRTAVYLKVTKRSVPVMSYVKTGGSASTTIGGAIDQYVSMAVAGIGSTGGGQEIVFSYTADAEL